MSKRKSSHFLFFILAVAVVLAGCGASLASAVRSCPTTQAGVVEGILSPQGYTVIEIQYPCPWKSAPILVASPKGQGSLVVINYESNSLTGEVGSIAIHGVQNQPVSFSYIAVQP